jgi:hypothetical protein
MDMFGRTSILVRVHTSKMIEYVHIGSVRQAVFLAYKPAVADLL